jgi:glutamate N-acetyltransferase / amino-acid N-acetyltransferase
VSVTYPRGFAAAGIAAGLKPSGAPDLGLLVGRPGTAAAGLFTTNRVAAAPVVLGRERLGGAPRAVLVNSGQANAATGARGLADAEKTTAAAAGLLGAAPEEVLPCSTGVIGEPVHVDELLAALPPLVEDLGPEGGAAFARAILTTDTVDKQTRAEAAEGIRVGGCAKGVGMISPSLATMLAFVTTDAAVAPADLRRLAGEALAPRFEALTVDGCTSTNDTVLLLASGAAGAGPLEPGSPGWQALAGAVAGVGEELAHALAADAEGGTRVLIVEVTGARDEAAARAVAKGVADSPLVKTAVFGADPNPGRVLQAAGAADASVDPEALSVRIGGVEVAHGGVIPPAYFEEGPLAEAAREAMAAPEVEIAVSLGDGPGRSRALGCDLSYGYVRINGEYTT